jgi:hypothetical protein
MILKQPPFTAQAATWIAATNGAAITPTQTGSLE